MATIIVRRPHKLQHNEARAAAETVAAHLRERFDLAYAWAGDVLKFQRPGVSGEMQVGPSEIVLSAHLGFMLSLLAPTIEREIHKNLDEVLHRA